MIDRNTAFTYQRQRRPSFCKPVRAPIARRSTYSYGIVELLWPLECAVSPLGIILVVVLILLLFGGLGGGSVVPYWGYGYGFGHGGIGVVGIILIVVIVLLLMGRL